MKSQQAQAGLIDTLTGLRGVAALWVFAYHIWIMAGPRQLFLPLTNDQIDITPFFSCGWAGVQIFFVLSGFLLGLQFAEWNAQKRPRPQTASYLVRRVLRVFPAYYAQVLILVAVTFATTGYWAINTWHSAFRHVFMFFMPFPSPKPMINGVWWTLPVEFSFYLVVPLFAIWLSPRYFGRLAVLCLAAMVCWRYAIVHMLTDAPISTIVQASLQLPGSLDSFGAGMLAATLHAHRDNLPTWSIRLLRHRLCPLFGVVIIVACMYWMHYGFHGYWKHSVIFYTWTPVLSLAIAMIVLAAAEGADWLKTLLANRPVLFVGTVSYSVYLWHLPVVDGFKQVFPSPILSEYRLFELIVLCTPLTILVAAISYWLVERPFLNLRHAFQPERSRNKAVNSIA